MKTLYECINETLGLPEIIKPGLDKFCRQLSVTLEKVDVEEFFKLFGETYKDQPRKPDSWLRGGTGCFSDDASWALVHGYLCYDNYGDYVSFLHKPTDAQLAKATEYLEKSVKKLLGENKKLWKSFDTKVKVSVLKYNSYYQPKGTYGIGVDFTFK